MNAQLVRLLEEFSGFLTNHAACMPPEVHAGEWSRGYVEGIAAAREMVLDALERGATPSPAPPGGPPGGLHVQGDQLLLDGRALQPGDEVELWLDGAWRRVLVERLDEPRVPGQLALKLRAIDWSGKVPKQPVPARRSRSQSTSAVPVTPAPVPLSPEARACALRLIEAVRAIDIPYESPLPRGVAAANLAACRLEELLDPRSAAQPTAT